MSEQNTDTTDTPEPSKPKIEFTPEQHTEINRIVAARTAEAAEKAAEARQAEIDTYLAAEAEQVQRAELEEVERLRLEADEAKAAAAAAEQARDASAREAAAVTALFRASVDPAVIGDALRLIDVAADDLDAEVAALSERLPAMFSGNQPPAPAGAGSVNPRNDQRVPSGKSARERALDRAQNMGMKVV